MAHVLCSDLVSQDVSWFISNAILFLPDSRYCCFAFCLWELTPKRLSPRRPQRQLAVYASSAPATVRAGSGGAINHGGSLGIRSRYRRRCNPFARGSDDLGHATEVIQDFPGGVGLGKLFSDHRPILRLHLAILPRSHISTQLAAFVVGRIRIGRNGCTCLCVASVTPRRGQWSREYSKHWESRVLNAGLCFSLGSFGLSV